MAKRAFSLEEAPRGSTGFFTSVGGGYSTTVSLSDLDHPKVLLVYGVEGEALERAYGGPLRMVIPQLYGYKSAKWLSRIEIVDSMRGGYWEDRRYSRSGMIEAGTTLDVNMGVRKPITGGEVVDLTTNRLSRNTGRCPGRPSQVLG